ncbi:MARVEL domain-containing protein 2 [Synchiropus splendidus]|uniref:MARVEL domain-containing protein 2 n=1 Tax=Synchiropus splendidus TaxID=270530 RepID=UPI00237D5351|nr:MARVEL domain-containing protein 2 [Synchiropus splendidus]XP_053739164.1 MARVEL domain-containing protein 2 [Synchiropus splendidus]XP_053739165.1 MARVEL domain-containing protein 2 [Synchiropus splendidus]
MKDRSGRFMRQESELGSSSSERNSIPDPPAPVWVTHTPDDDDTHSSNPSTSTCQENNNMSSMKDKLKSLFGSWRSSPQQSDGSDPETGPNRVRIVPNGTRVSPPASPLQGCKNWDTPSDLLYHPEESLLTSIHPAEYYAEKVELYNQKYSYLKSWPGLLRLLAGLELLFGAMALACVIAYIQKDSEWNNVYGQYNGIYNAGMGLPGYSYQGPMTPFILSVVGLSWIITVILMVLGLTMYYRTILLDAPWWPLTEAFINVALFLLYMAAGIVYLNDLNRGGLCYMTIGVNPIMASLCRVDGGQMAGTAFLFINMALYLGSFLVSLKMWRHEAQRRERELFNCRSTEQSHRVVPLLPKTTKISFKDEPDGPVTSVHQVRPPQEHQNHVKKTLGPAVQIVPDYVLKYPDITSAEERDSYKAVFNDQYQEYKDLHRDISITLTKFTELDQMMTKLIRGGKTQEEQQRIQSILATYQQKKNDPALVEKKERCDYLKAKLNHIKGRIQSFDQQTVGGSR